MSDQPLPDIPLPSGWPGNVKSAVLHVISLAHCDIIDARGLAANNINARVRLAADNRKMPFFLPPPLAARPESYRALSRQEPQVLEYWRSKYSVGTAKAGWNI